MLLNSPDKIAAFVHYVEKIERETRRVFTPPVVSCTLCGSRNSFIYTTHVENAGGRNKVADKQEHLPKHLNGLYHHSFCDVCHRSLTRSALAQSTADGRLAFRVVESVMVVVVMMHGW